MEKLILGMLMLRGMTVYEMKTLIDSRLDSMCSSSSGSIHSAVTKLLQKEFIECEEEENKKYYKITEAGRNEFNQWIQQPMDSSKAKNMELSKLFFLGLSQPDSVKPLILQYITAVEKEHEYLNQLKAISHRDSESIKKMAQAITSEEFHNEEGMLENLYDRSYDEITYDVYEYQMATLQYGIDSAEFEIAWYKRLLKQIEK